MSDPDQPDDSGANPYDDLFGKIAGGRPDHPDYTTLSEVLLRMDASIPPGTSPEDGEAAFERRMTEVDVDVHTLSHVALQRSYRMVGVTNALDLMNPAKVQQSISLSSAWIDGFVAGALYRMKKEN